MAPPAATAWPAALAAQPDDPPDAALLGRFLADRNEAAFRMLLARHGPMVLGVCRRVLGDAHAAEDAFQATFLVLVRRAADAARDRLGPWLYGMAVRTARKARTVEARRRTRERAAAGQRPATIWPAEPTGDLGPVLDNELRRLPAELRAAVVVCDLQGHSRRTAARLLGLPESTLSSRLAVARRRLAGRLAARGVVPSVAGLVAAVPPALADRAAAAALGGSVSPPVVALSQEVLHAMTWPRKLVAAVLVVAAATVGTVLTAADDRTPAPRLPGRAKAARAEADGFRFLAFDGFDGQFGLNWQVVRPDPAHASLARSPGRLTITSQHGTISGPGTTTATGMALTLQTLMDGKGKPAEGGTYKLKVLPDGHLTKNLYLIDNPLAADADFTVTTCVVGFDPRVPYQQAGLVLYTDDDHYLKWTYECNDTPGPEVGVTAGAGWKLKVQAGDAPETRGNAGQPQTFAPWAGGMEWSMVREVAEPRPAGRPYFIAVGEVGGAATRHVTAEAGPRLPRVWLRVAKRGNLYDFYTSTDGERFVKHGTADWGKGGPKRVGLIAQNGGEAGGVSGVPGADAQFEFFELRAGR